MFQLSSFLYGRGGCSPRRQIPTCSAGNIIVADDDGEEPLEQGSSPESTERTTDQKEE